MDLVLLMSGSVAVAGMVAGAGDDVADIISPSKLVQADFGKGQSFLHKND